MTNLEQDILNTVTGSDGKFIPSRTCERYLSSRGWSEYLKSRYTDNVTDSFAEILFRLKNNIETIPVCKACGKPVKFVNSKGYSTYCSPKCRNNDPAVKEKNSKRVSESLKRIYFERGDEIKEKRRKTLSEHYDVSISSSSPFSVKEISDAAKSSVLEKYGVKNIFKTDKVRMSSRETILKHSVERWHSRGFDIEYLEDGSICIKNGCSIHGDVVMSPAMFNSRMCNDRCHTTVFCPICRPDYVYSSGELSLKNFLDTLDVSFRTNDRKIISPQELDFYFPENNFAIEYNGIFYHSDAMKESGYHLNKYLAAKNKNIDVLFVWEHEWIQKSDIVKGDIIRKLKISPCYIRERDCTVSCVERTIAREFVNSNTLVEFEDDTESFGLYFNDKLCCLISYYVPIYSNYAIIKNFAIRNDVDVDGITSLLSFSENSIGRQIYLVMLKRDSTLKNYFSEAGFVLSKNIEPFSFCVDGNLMRSGIYPITKSITNSATYRCFDCGKELFIK